MFLLLNLIEVVLFDKIYVLHQFIEKVVTDLLETDNVRIVLLENFKQFFKPFLEVVIITPYVVGNKAKSVFEFAGHLQRIAVEN